jgi:hypothetical protein
MLHGPGPGQCEAVDPRAERRQHSRQERQRGREHKPDRERDPHRARAEGLAGHQHHGRQRREDGQPAHQHGLPGGVHGLRDRVDRAQADPQRRAEAHHHEECVVDADREGEHQREVHRPDRDPQQVGAEPKRPGGGRQPRDREQQRDARSRERTEHHHQHRPRQRPRHELRANHGRLVLLVELRPQSSRPVSATSTPGGATAFSRSPTPLAACTISSVSGRAPPRITAT